jgi:integrase
MASVRKRILESGETRWLVDYRDLAGTRRARQFATKKEAVDFETKVRADIAAGVHVADTASITVREAADLWLQRAQTEALEPSTRKQYREHINIHIVPLLGGTKLSRLTRPAVESFRDQLLETRSRALTRKVLTSLKGILSEAQRRGLINQNVATGTKVSMPKRYEEEVEIPAKDEIRAIINKAGELWPPEGGLPWRTFVVVALFTGARLSELRGLTWDNVSLANGHIRIRPTRGFSRCARRPEIQGRKKRYSARPHGSECPEGLVARLFAPLWWLRVSK